MRRLVAHHKAFELPLLKGKQNTQKYMRIYTDEITHHPEVEKRIHEVSIICTEAQQNNREEPYGSSRFSYPQRGGIKVNAQQIH